MLQRRRRGRQLWMITWCAMVFGILFIILFIQADSPWRGQIVVIMSMFLPGEHVPPLLSLVLHLCQNRLLRMVVIMIIFKAEATCKGWSCRGRPVPMRRIPTFTKINYHVYVYQNITDKASLVSSKNQYFNCLRPPLLKQFQRLYSLEMPKRSSVL